MRIRARRTALRLTQEQLARQAGLGRKAIGELETGRRQPTARSLHALAGALQVSATWLLTGEESADEVELAQTRDIALILRNQDEFARGLASLERDLRDLYRLVERLAEQQVRFLGPSLPPRPDSPQSAS